MGVHGWTSFLRNEGWLPSRTNSCGCVTELWRDQRCLETNDAFTSRIVTIPDQSTLHIDGYGLAFYVWEVAYERYARTILQCSPCSVSARNASTKCVDLQELIPLMVPLQYIDEMTREYMSDLLHHFRVKVYFDGDGRRVIHQSPSGNVSKQETSEKRHSVRRDTWENLRLYCSQGLIPPTKTICGWRREFPHPRLVFDQFRHALRSMNIPMEACKEESDHIIARAVCGDPTAFILGNDSDFCFFSDVNYIPFESLHVSAKLATACVLRRDSIASSLAISDESMVELAILCGNDYLVDPTTSKLDFCSRDVQKCIDHLWSQPTETVYHVTSQDVTTEEILAFIRVHYNLGDLSPFPLKDDGSSSDDEKDNDRNLQSSEGGMGMRDQRPAEGGASDPACRSIVPSTVNFDLARIEGVDTSVKQAVVRCLQDHVNQTAVSGDSPVKQEHLDAFSLLHVTPTKERKGRATWRQAWEDNAAIYVITRVIGASLQLSSNCLLVRICSPSSLFDFYQFHDLLHSRRALLPASVHVVEPNIVRHFDDSPQLPIDEYEEEILTRIRENRVSIIQAETGAGKSSRVPVMILNAEPPDPSVPVKLFISQPRRIAAKALVERLRATEPQWKDCFALRMGHGIREYESHNTRAWFVTAGYLVRFLAKYPERFDKVSHLIIDEVHERSVETDLLCLLCRRLLHVNDRIRLVLMSATLAAKLYQDYFGVPEHPLEVGAKRFPVEEVFLDDLSTRFALPPKIKRHVSDLIGYCNQVKCKQPPSISYMESLYPVVAHIAIVVAQPGTSVLVFVPGMNEIVALTDAIEQLFVDGIRVSCLPIHSDIPFEDQLDAFQQPEANEVKVILATNAAESSVTLPAVDNVICCGLCKQIIYNETSHRQMLVPTWISKASATQRAGRTGRLRPGCVYRIYTNENFLLHMDEFEPGEMSRMPLDNVILMLKGMVVDDTATNILLECLEPPNLSTIDHSYRSLYRSHFITSPSDEFEVTTLGNFVSTLGIDLALGSVIGLGIQMSVGAEAIQLAAVLSFPKTPWTITNPLIHESGQYNDITKRSYISRCHFDANLYSEPLAVMNMLWEFERTKSKDQWCYSYSLSRSRVQRLHGLCNTLRRRVADFFEIDESHLRVQTPPICMPHAMLNTLRVIQVWVFHDSLIQCKLPKNKAKSLGGVYPLTLGNKSPTVSNQHLDQVLCSKRHPYEIVKLRKVVKSGSYVVAEGGDHRSADLESRLLSYAMEKRTQVLMLAGSKTVYLYAVANPWEKDEFASLRENVPKALYTTVIKLAPAAEKRRGVGERACGQWIIHSRFTPERKTEALVSDCFWSFSFSSSDIKSLRQALENFFGENHSVCGLLIELKRSSGSQPKHAFSAVSFGTTHPVSDVDLNDLFGVSGVNCSKPKESSGAQVLRFQIAPNKPLQKSMLCTSISETSWARPIVNVIPEGARLLSVNASGRRREHVLRVFDEQDASATIDIFVDPSTTKLSQRWVRMNSDSAVYVNENSVPATAFPLEGELTLYCVASNALEVRGGGLRVEGLTLLPPGRLFLLLARFSFGLFDHENLLDNLLEKNSIGWLKGSDYRIDRNFESSWGALVQKAVSFHQDATSLGEELLCSPEYAQRLTELFNGLDGYEAPSWDIESNPLTRENLVKLKRAYKDGKVFRTDSEISAKEYSENPKSSPPTARLRDNIGGRRGRVQESIQKSKVIQKPSSKEMNSPMTTPMANGLHATLLSAFASTSLRENGRNNNSMVSEEAEQTQSDEGSEIRDAELIMSATKHLNEDGASATTPRQSRVSRKENLKVRRADRLEEIRNFDASTLEMSHRLFATTLPAGQDIDQNEFPATNILALVVERAREALGLRLSPFLNIEDPQEWRIFAWRSSSKKMWYGAHFQNFGLRYLPLDSRKANLPDWMTRGNSLRPLRPKDAANCIPPAFRRKVCGPVLVLKKPKSLGFESLEIALKMEAAFWLDRQFQDDRHWYEQGDVPQMIEKLVAACKE